MLNKKYFEDAFILHEQTSEMRKLVCSEAVFDVLKTYHKPDMSDPIADLLKRWARFRIFYKFQPLNDIKNYFGEANALYFAWLGILILTLSMPALIGVLFFVIGLIMRQHE